MRGRPKCREDAEFQDELYEILERRYDAVIVEVLEELATGAMDRAELALFAAGPVEDFINRAGRPEAIDLLAAACERNKKLRIATS